MEVGDFLNQKFKIQVTNKILKSNIKHLLHLKIWYLALN